MIVVMVAHGRRLLVALLVVLSGAGCSDDAGAPAADGAALDAPPADAAVPAADAAAAAPDAAAPTAPPTGAGTGGDFEFTLQTDDGNGSPSGTALATMVYRDVASGAGRNFPLLTFPTPAPVVAGQRYHLVVRNVNATPRANFSSMDHLYLA